jgi:hypothetical protein
MRPLVTVAHLLLLMLILLIVGSTEKVMGQGTDNKESYKLIKEVMDRGSRILTAMEKNDLEIVKVDIDLVGMIESKYVLKVFNYGDPTQKHYTYVITAIGQPSRISLLNIEVYHMLPSGNPRFVTRSESLNANPTVTVDMTDREAGSYQIVIIVTKMFPGMENWMGYYFLAIAHN